jgi:hypothetical protein
MRIGFTGCTAFDVEVLAHTTLKSVPAMKVGRINLPIERFEFNFILTPEFLCECGLRSLHLKYFKPECSLMWEF